MECHSPQGRSDSPEYNVRILSQNWGTQLIINKHQKINIMNKKEKKKKQMYKNSQSNRINLSVQK